MTKSVYIIGGAGTGKSTFTQDILDLSNRSMSGPLIDLHSKPNSRGTVITLRGHEIGTDGIYLGCMRDSFPGTDGLDRVSYIPGEEWLESGGHESWDFLVAEGATLAVRRFMHALHEHTDLLLIHLFCDEFIKELRFDERGSSQNPKFVEATTTRSQNLAVDMSKAGVKVWTVDSAEPEEWDRALEIVHEHLEFP